MRYAVQQVPSPCLNNQTYTHAGAGELAFCSGGDQSVRGKGGYVGEDGIARLNVLDLQVSGGGGGLVARFKAMGTG